MASSTMSMDSGLYPESPLDQDDVIYPCKGCGEILEEGKAFELAGNRWHLDCFKCHSCNTLLDSDANLLLLGDGSLICNNCTYSCNACGNKIEDLAILTGDQAFCASCFRCRNCKRKIENLRYARTSQGIFCMSCHESLMARRRKKGRNTSSRQAQGGATTSISSDKALPSLPPGAMSTSAFSPDIETPSPDVYSESVGPVSPQQQPTRSRKEISPNTQRDVSPMSDEAHRDDQTLPASTYNERKPSNVSESAEEDGFLPMAFDPTPVSAKPTAAIPPRKPVTSDAPAAPPTLAQSEARLPRDYFGRQSAKPPIRDVLRDENQASSSRSDSTERDSERNSGQPKTSPHILFQEKGRHRKRDVSGSSTPGASPALGTHQERSDKPKPQRLDTSSATLSSSTEDFKLGDVPKGKKNSSRSSSRARQSPILPIPSNVTKQDRNDRTASPLSLDSPSSGINPFDDPKRKENPPTSGAHPPPRHADRPTRGDSLTPAPLKGARSPTPEPVTPTIMSSQPVSSHNRQTSTSSFPASLNEAAQNTPRTSISKNDTWPSARASLDGPPPRASSRISAPSKSVANGDFIAPRAPPAPPLADRPHRRNESASTLRSIDRSDLPSSPAIKSATLPRHNADGSLSMEDEMARILRGDKRESQSTTGDGNGPSVLRRVSNAVKHGRSFSDRALESTRRTPPRGGLDIGHPMSPVISSPSQTNANEQLKIQLRRANQRIAELESEKNGLQETVNNSAEIKAASNELKEKRNTMVVLDTQREMLVAELESMTSHLQKAKESNLPLDVTQLKTEMLQDFTDSMRKVKDHMSQQIEDLMHKRNELTEEIGNLIQMKDKGFQEFESVSSKNAQLLEMNNQLVAQIQEMYKANRIPNGSTNGLGIYQTGSKAETPSLTDVRNLNVMSANSSSPDLIPGNEAEPATVLTAPQVVNIRKGQPKKFNWRKGGEKMAKNVTKGLKGAFAGDKLPLREGQTAYGDIGVPYGSTSIQAMPGSEQNSISSRHGNPPGSAGFGLFNNQKNGNLKPGAMGTMKNNSSTNVSAVVDASVLFGSELEARCEYEKRVVPSIVTHCVDEVELRGMDVEGIYRKSGGSSQVKSVQQGFENNGDHDISDVEIDIHAVTSALKQYFRKLPTPLITYEVYDILLDAGQTTEPEKQVYALRKAVSELPEHHRNCLEFLIQHLARVMSHDDVNLMTPLNIAVVFAPTIMRPLSIEREMSDMQAQRTAVQALLEHHEAIFDPEE